MQNRVITFFTQQINGVTYVGFYYGQIYCCIKLICMKLYNFKCKKWVLNYHLYDENCLLIIYNEATGLFGFKCRKYL